MSIFFAVIYGLFYTMTIKKILTTHHTVSTFSFTGFALTNLGLGISNGFHIGSAGYFTAFLMGSITVACNLYITRQVKLGILIPNSLS